MIQVENLSFSYQNNKVFKNLSFSIKKGEYLCIIGKNGSGKSTLAKLLAGLIFKQEGSIKISGYDTKNQKDLLEIRKLVGIIFQNPENQIINTTVFDEVVFGLENLATPRENIKEIAENSLKSVALLEYKDRLTYQLSGGEKQRLAIASVLAMGTEILIFDEAISMLDPVGKKEVLKLMKELNSQGKTIIHITHNRNDILEASEVMVLSNGEIKYQGNPYKIFEDDEFNPFLIKIKNILEKTKYEIKKYSPNESIAFRGDEVKGLYIILKGTLITEMLTEEGNVIKIEELVPSDVIASAFIFGKKNSFPVDLSVKDEAEILFVERKEFLKLLFSEEKILENFLNEISNKTQLLTNKIWNSFNNKTIKKKFCDYVKKNQKNNLFSIQNLGALAEFFGVERPSLSRVLSELVKDEKLERIGRNKYKILDIEFFEI